MAQLKEDRRDLLTEAMDPPDLNIPGSTAAVDVKIIDRCEFVTKLLDQQRTLADVSIH